MLNKSVKELIVNTVKNMSKHGQFTIQGQDCINGINTYYSYTFSREDTQINIKEHKYDLNNTISITTSSISIENFEQEFESICKDHQSIWVNIQNNMVKLKDERTE